MNDVIQKLKSRVKLSKEFPFAVPLMDLIHAILEKLQTIEKMEGPKGEQGDTGLQGLPGATGSPGLQGIPGSDGKTGKDGKDGRTGPKGDRGERGLPGPTGAVGKIGPPGPQGLKGHDGSPDTGRNIKKKLEDLKGDDRLSASSIKDIPTVVRELPNFSFLGPRGGSTNLIVTSDGISLGQDIRRLNFSGMTGYRSSDGSATLTVDPVQSGYTVENQTSATLNETATSGLVVILANATNNNITINLPTAVGNTAQITIKKTDSSTNTVTIDGSGTEKVDDGLTAVLRKQYESVTLVTDQSNWFII